MGERKQILAVIQFCVLLFVGTPSGLWAQTGTLPPAPINRPQRSIRSDAPPSIPHFPLSTLYSSLLTAENLDQPLTKHYIERYSNKAGIDWINSIIRNGSVYFPYIRNEIERCGLPPELIYLPFIESGYVGTARSKSGAVGLWQFMMNSIGSLLKVNDLIDERRDFRKATVAALQKLESNYRVLGNWPMALAAYNAGLGAASRIVQRAKTGDYWEICEKKEFKTETVHYVPKFLAVAYILSNPRKFGVDFWPETVEWTTVKPGKQASLDVIASETGIDRALLYQLNQELLHGITPPDKNYELIVPLSHADTITRVLDREDLPLLWYYRYQISYGDTLSALSRHYGISVDMIEQYNPGIKNRFLKIGEVVILPALKETSPYVRAADPQPTPPAGKTSVFNSTYTVKSGDTLWSIANRFQVDPPLLARENNLALDSILSIGKILKVPIIE